MIRLSPRDLWLLALLTISWGINWPIMKIGVQHFPPMTFRTISMTGGLVVLWALVRSQGVSMSVPRRYWRELALIGLTNMAIWFILSIYGVKLLSSGRAAILGYTMPIWTAIWGALRFGDHPAPRVWYGLVAATGGVVLLLVGEFTTITGRPAGTFCMLAAAAVWGLGSHLMRRRRQQSNVLVITFWSLALSFVICGLFSVLVERSQWTRWPDAAEWGAIAYNAIVIFGFSQVMWFRLASMLPPVASGLSVMLIPVTGVFAGMAILGETPTWRDYVALVTILVAIATVLLPTRAPEVPPVNPET